MESIKKLEEQLVLNQRKHGSEQFGSGHRGYSDMTVNGEVILVYSLDSVLQSTCFYKELVAFVWMWVSFLFGLMLNFV